MPQVWMSEEGDYYHLYVTTGKVPFVCEPSFLRRISWSIAISLRV